MRPAPTAERKHADEAPHCPSDPELLAGDRVVVGGGGRCAPARSIDSRVGDDTAIPDPELHDTTVAAALAASRPAVVVVSTPSYCQSRFCGPIADSVADIALASTGANIAFIHARNVAVVLRWGTGVLTGRWVNVRIATDRRLLIAGVAVLVVLLEVP